LSEFVKKHGNTRSSSINWWSY